MGNGKFRGNPHAGLTNSTRFNKCGDFPTCVDSVEVETTLTGDAVTLFVYEGVDYPVSTTAGNSDAIVAALLEILAPFEIDPVVTASFADSTLTITHEGAGTLSSVTVDGDPEAFTRTC